MAESKTDSPEGLDVKTESPKPAKKGPDKGGFYWGTGRRKSSVARVRIKPGDGKMLINKKPLSDYFPREQDRKAVISPLQAVEAEKSFDVFVVKSTLNEALSFSALCFISPNFTTSHCIPISCR